MGKGKDFYGKDISEVIEQACKELGASHEQLDIEVIETGSAGIFGLCKKKAHIRVQKKASVPEEQAIARPSVDKGARPAEMFEGSETSTPATEAMLPPPAESRIVTPAAIREEHASSDTDEQGDPEQFEQVEEEEVLDTPSEEGVAAIRADLERLLMLMGLPSEVAVHYEDNTVHCQITGSHEEQIVGPEGRTLDSLQYLLRKMVSPHLPDRIMLSLNAGNFRERRAEELKIRAVELAALVKEDGKTQSIPALNPSERRVVHMALQEDKGVRSRSVGEGLFKKVLIYKPGKGRRPASKKRRGGQGGQPSGD
jgi:spoIIIJ-associated protein